MKGDRDAENERQRLYVFLSYGSCDMVPFESVSFTPSLRTGHRCRPRSFIHTEQPKTTKGPTVAAPYPQSHQRKLFHKASWLPKAATASTFGGTDRVVCPASSLKLCIQYRIVEIICWFRSENVKRLSCSRRSYRLSCLFFIISSETIIHFSYFKPPCSPWKFIFIA